jgi:hypothetical protein
MLADNRKSGIVFTILCAKPVVFIGLLSYSLYLWHWPIWVAMEWMFNHVSGLQVIAYFILTFVVAYLSYRIVEKPLRNASFYKPRVNKLVLPSLVLSVVASISIFMIYSNKQILPISQTSLASYQAALKKEPHRDKCTDTKRLNGNFSICHLKDSAAPTYTILLWGDSHASAFMSAFVEFSDQYSIYAINTSGCPSLINTKRRGSQDCHLHNEFVQKHLLESYKHYDMVVNASAWDNYIEFNLLETETSQTEEMRIALQKTIAFYNDNDINFAFIPQIPKHKPNVPLDFFKEQIGIVQNTATISKDMYEAKLTRFKEMIAPSENFVSFENIFCIDDCLSSINDTILYQDQHHLSVAGGKVISPYLEQKITKIIRNKKSPILLSVNRYAE